MSTLLEIAEAFTTLDGAATDHLLRLTSSWSLLADLSFSDMVLLVPDRDATSDFLVLAQVRPNNRSTMVADDLIGTRQSGAEWASARQALEAARLVVGDVAIAGVRGRIPVWCIPVRFKDDVIAVLVRLQGQLRGPASLYEQVYLSIFERLCTMVSEATFPFREDTVAGPGMPRVGDGIILVNGLGQIEFATPNATNALHRLGLYTSFEGRTFAAMGFPVRVVDRALDDGLPVMDVVEGPKDVAITFHCVPLFNHGLVTGVLVLVRDISDVRQLNRAVLNKEAAVREVHHRVKNNLQTISSLLRLQGRRSEQEETRIALQEAERRVRSIAVVHEVLSREPGEEVDFDQIIASVVTLVEDTWLTPQPMEMVVNGSLGMLATDVATPLALALTELLTNAAEHAFVARGDDDGRVGVISLNLSIEEGRAVALIRDNGRGLTPGFSLDAATSLGLSIVRDLIRAQLHGTIDMISVDADQGGGTQVRVSIPTRVDR